MPDDQSLPPVRVRIRSKPAADGGEPEDRLVADRESPAHQKRQPNSGSMKPGETRNPNGRPKGAKGTRAIVRKVLGANTPIREKGRQRMVSRWEAVLLRELQLASEGEWRARKTIIELGRWALPEDEPGRAAASSPGEVSAVDQAIIDWFETEAASRKREAAGGTDSSGEAAE